MSATWVQTTRRLLPRLVGLARQLRPTYHLASVAALDLPFVRKNDVGALLWDVDGTLMPHHARGVAPELRPAVETLFAAPGLRHAIVSNCQEERFAELGGIFPELPIVLGYETADGPAYRIRRGGEEAWRGPGAARAEAEPGPLSPIRKPSAELVRAAIEELGLSDRPQRVLMVGDQYFTDIASANLAGIRSAKVPTLARDSFPLPVRWSQRLEALLYRLKYGRPSSDQDGRPSPEEES